MYINICFCYVSGTVASRWLDSGWLLGVGNKADAVRIFKLVIWCMLAEEVFLTDLEMVWNSSRDLLADVQPSGAPSGRGRGSWALSGRGFQALWCSIFWGLLGTAGWEIYGKGETHTVYRLDDGHVWQYWIETKYQSGWWLRKKSTSFWCSSKQMDNAQMLLDE